MWYGEVGLSTQLAPNVGGPLPPMGLPAGESKVAPVRKMTPLACLTPLTCCTVATSADGTGSRWPPPMSWEAPASVCPSTTTAIPWLASVKMAPKTLLMVSPTTNVDDTKAIPSTMATAVRLNRSLWASSPRSVTLSTPSGAEVLHDVEDPVRGRRAHLVDGLAVGDEDHAVCVGGGQGIVGDHDDGLHEVLHRGTQETEQLGP